MGLELRVVISANINSTIAVILSPNLSLYDLQKPRYDFYIFALKRTILHVPSTRAVNGQTTNFVSKWIFFYALKLNRSETLGSLKFTQNFLGHSTGLHFEKIRSFWSKPLCVRQKMAHISETKMFTLF